MLAVQDDAATSNTEAGSSSPYHETDTLSSAPQLQDSDSGKASNYGSGPENVTVAIDGKAGPAGAVLNFVNSIIGAGIIGLPFALREAGVIGGLL
jgi:sodium-coupled neutral amino acid transporter 11